MHFSLTPFLHIPAPWNDCAINTAEDNSRVDIIVEHDRGTLWACPHCSEREPTLLYRDHNHLR